MCVHSDFTDAVFAIGNAKAGTAVPSNMNCSNIVNEFNCSLISGN